MSLNTPPPNQNITLTERASETFWRWMTNVKASIDALTGSVATLETTISDGLAGAGNVSAASEFSADGQLLKTSGTSGRNIAPVTQWTVDAGGNITGTRTGATSADQLILNIRSEFQAVFYPTTYSNSGSSFLGGRKARGTISAPTAIQTNDALFNIGGRGYDGTVGPLDGFSGTSCLFSFRAAEVWTTTAHGTYAAIFTQPIGSVAGQIERIRIEDAGHTRPAANNTYNLGTASFLWKEVFAAIGVINTSDERLKEVVGKISWAGQFVDLLEPCLYRWLNGGNTIEPCPSGAMEPNPAGDVDEFGRVIMQPKMVPIARDGVRHHAGFMAQHVKRTMDDVGHEFAAWCLADKNDPNSTQHVRPDQLSAVLWEALRQTRSWVRSLVDRLTGIDDRIAKLEQRIDQLEGAKS